MIQFFDVFLKDITNNEFISFSLPSGSPTPVVILDDGWAPNITKYVRDGEKTWSDVVEELECMTNVATRDEALALLEKLNALIHRAARDIEEKQQYTVSFFARSQFSTASNAAFTFVISPPDDGNVITLSTDIQTAPPGQIKFKLRFKRTGAWITTFNDITHSGALTSDINPPSGYWKLQTTLPTNITIPTPVSLSLSFSYNSTNRVNVKDFFICFNVLETYVVKNFSIIPIFNMYQISYPSWRLAQENKGYAIVDNTDSYSSDVRPFSSIYLPQGTYAVFVAWRSVQSNVAHRLQIQFNNNTETRNTLLLATDTEPKYQYFGTVKTTKHANFLYLRTTIGHSTGYEIEKILLVRLKETSTIISLSDWFYNKYAIINIENRCTLPFKTVFIDWNSRISFLSTYDSVDIISDNSLLNAVVIGNSPNVFSLRTDSDYFEVISLPVTITYRQIRTTFH